MTGRYFVSILVLQIPVMCGTIEAASLFDARAKWEAKFWSGPDELRDAIPSMDRLNREASESFLKVMERTRDDARRWGITVTARRSRAKAPPL